jgi:hypothetical protein
VVKATAPGEQHSEIKVPCPRILEILLEADKEENVTLCTMTDRGVIHNTREASCSSRCY